MQASLEGGPLDTVTEKKRREMHSKVQFLMQSDGYLILKISIISEFAGVNCSYLQCFRRIYPSSDWKRRVVIGMHHSDIPTGTS